MKRFLAFVFFWPMMLCLIALAGLLHLAKLPVMLCVTVADLATPLVLRLAEIIDGEA